MEEVKRKLDDIVEDISEMKVNVAKIEINHERTTDILDRLTSSVEHHIKRTDELQDLVIELKLQQELTKADLQKKKELDRMILYTLGAVGTILLAFKELGLLDKLF